MLTGLPNRLLSTDRLERALAHAERNDVPVGVLYIDLDRFKDVNDSFGQSESRSSAAIVAATIAMTRTLGLTMVAKGVETEDQRRFLESQGCDRLQGYHLGRPMPAEDLAERLRIEDLSVPEAAPRSAAPPLLAAPHAGMVRSAALG